MEGFECPVAFLLPRPLAGVNFASSVQSKNRRRQTGHDKDWQVAVFALREHDSFCAHFAVLAMLSCCVTRPCFRRCVSSCVLLPMGLNFQVRRLLPEPRTCRPIPPV